MGFLFNACLIVITISVVVGIICWIVHMANWYDNMHVILFIPGKGFYTGGVLENKVFYTKSFRKARAFTLKHGEYDLILSTAELITRIESENGNNSVVDNKLKLTSSIRKDLERIIGTNE